MALITFFALIFTAVPTLNAYAAESHTGSYTGTGSAYTGATVSFDIDDNGVMSNFNTTSYCFDGLYSQPVTWVGMPATTVQPGVPFEVNWEYNTGDVSPYYELTGTVNADGSANGTGRAGFLPYGTCGGFEFSWSAERVGGGEPEPVYDPTLLITPETISLADLTYTSTALAAGTYTVVLDADAEGATVQGTLTVEDDPEPVYNPSMGISPAELTISELADTGVQITAQGIPADVAVQFFVNGTATEELASNAQGEVSFTFVSASLGVGEHEIRLEADAQGATIAVSFTVIEDAVIPEPEPEPDPDPEPEPGNETEPGDGNCSGSDPETAPVEDVQAGDGLATTGASSVTMFIAGAALLLVLTGGLVMLFNRRRSTY